ncbi:sterol desaturase family protein [Streptomyces sp. ISL-98]|uniref:sterol desaturase family protein n=1 Tax=Streptomyces sp. ISL-98 TaxID=2819192 RepID=UPI001BEB702D|nr:sterol desaturase family protein [Streptomyces sp. ISL-98]MBT2509810.1 sterol desaturase family protein [Streptomyces sp. ISL-98]
MTAAVAWAFQTSTGTGLGCAATSGFTVGYVIYDTLHYYLHHHRPTSRIGRSLRRRHMQHHFRDNRTGFGVSCPYWDYVFGTAPLRRNTSA